MIAPEKKSRVSTFGIITFILALLSFIMSATALLMTYDNGRLLKDAQTIFGELRVSVKEKRSAFFYTGSEQTSPGMTEEGKFLHQLRTRLDGARKELSESRDYAAARKKVEEINRELISYQQKAGSLSLRTYNGLKSQCNDILLSLREKSSDSLPKMESLCRELSTLANKKEEK